MIIKLNNESINSFLDRVHLSKKKINFLKDNKRIDGKFDNYDSIIINNYINFLFKNDLIINESD